LAGAAVGISQAHQVKCVDIVRWEHHIYCGGSDRMQCLYLQVFRLLPQPRIVLHSVI